MDLSHWWAVRRVAVSSGCGGRVERIGVGVLGEGVCARDGDGGVDAFVVHICSIDFPKFISRSMMARERNFEQSC